MTEPVLPNGAPDVPWPTGDHRMRVPDTSMLPQAAYAPPATVAALRRAVQGAHDAVDDFADNATPRLRQLSDRLAGAEAAWRARAESLRDGVRRHPLVAVAVALAVGAVVSRAGRRWPRS